MTQSSEQLQEEIEHAEWVLSTARSQAAIDQYQSIIACLKAEERERES
jgi:hypothetical protein